MSVNSCWSTDSVDFLDSRGFAVSVDFRDPFGSAVPVNLDASVDCAQMVEVDSLDSSHHSIQAAKLQTCPVSASLSIWNLFSTKTSKILVNDRYLCTSRSNHLPDKPWNILASRCSQLSIPRYRLRRANDDLKKKWGKWTDVRCRCLIVITKPSTYTRFVILWQSNWMKIWDLNSFVRIEKSVARC
jgi:hypothetical protein